MTKFGTSLLILFSLLQEKETSDTCYFAFSKQDATTFLTDGRRPTKEECCPRNTIECYSYENRCSKDVTGDDGQHAWTPYDDGGDLNTRIICPTADNEQEYVDNHGDDNVTVLSCQHGGTCLKEGKCNCADGFTGEHCQININECESSPCKNNATCEDRVNRFHCQCPPKIYGVLCDTNICHPTPADVVFVLDSSVSMTDGEFKKQLEFVANFSNTVPIGINDTQISVVTFSCDAHVEFYLNQHENKTSLYDAIMNVTYKPGITRTEEGLKVVRTKVFTESHGIKRRINGTKATRFVYVLTDGMSTNKTNTKAEALKLKHEVDAIAVIGVGNEVLHQELLDIASDPSFVFSVNNLNSLYTVLRQLVQLCDECETSMASDVAIFLDSSFYITTEQFNLMVDAIMHIIDAMNHLNVNGTHASVTTFSDDIKSIMNMGETFNKNVIKSKVNMVSKSADEHQATHLETVFAYVRDKIFNNTFSMRTANKFLLIFTNGKAHVNSKSTFESEKSMLEADGVNIVAIGSGEDIDMNGLIKLVTDTFNVFVTSKDLPMNNLDVLQSEFVNSKCNITGE